MQRFTDEHFDQLQFWAKFRGGKEILRDYRAARNDKAEVLWCAMWVRVAIHSVPQIETIEGGPAKCRPTSRAGVPYIETNQGWYSLDEAYGEEYLPTLTDIEAAKQAIRDAWTYDEACERQTKQGRVIRAPRPSKRDRVAAEVTIRRWLDGDR
jgi:hypothetical protein